MNRDKNSSKINDPNSGERSIKDKLQKGQGHAPKDDATETDTKSAEKETKDVPGTIIMDLDTPYYDPETLSVKKNSGVKVFDYSMVTSRAGESGSPQFIDVRDAMVSTGNPTYEEENQNSPKEVILKCPTPKNSPIYNINLRRRGKCVIFNHENFDPDNGSQRVGTSFDVKAIEHTFGKLGFEVVVHNDLQWHKVNAEVVKLSQEDYTDCGCICIFVLTHGDAGGRLSARDASYPFLSIWRPFKADNCTTLFGKPKIFFTQACRGGQYDEPIRGRSETDYNDQSYTLPSQADFLFGFSTLDGFYSIREREKGSWYIQTLCNVINDHWKTHDLVKMLTITSRRVGMENLSLNQKKQMPTITSTLTRDIVFSSKILSDLDSNT